VFRARGGALKTHIFFQTTTRLAHISRPLAMTPAAG